MKVLISVFFVTIAITLLSQNTKIDSLQQLLNQAKGSERIDVLNDLAYAYGYIDCNKSIDLAKEALLVAEYQKYNKSLALTYDILGRAYFISGNYKAAEEYYNKCISTANIYGTKDDIYKALRHKTIMYTNGYITNPSELEPVYKEYIKMSLEKNNSFDFEEGLKSFIYVSKTQRFEDSKVSSYLLELKKSNTKNVEFLPVLFACEAFHETLNLKYFNAIEKYMAALELTKDDSKKISYLERIGVVFFEIRKYKESVKYLKEALKLAEDKKNEPNSFIYFMIEADLGASYLQLKDFKSGINSLNIALQCPYFSFIDKCTLYNNIGMCYLSIDSLDRADSYFVEAISMINTIDNPRAKLAIMNSQAELLIKRKQEDQLTNVLSDISILVTKVDDYYIKSDSYSLLSDYYEKSGNHQKSNEYLKKRVTANDSINNIDFQIKISELEYKYETEKKEQQINAQQNIIAHKNNLIVFAVIAGSIILGALLVIFILYRIKNKAYKLLVYKSLKKTTHTELVKIEENKYEEIKNTNTVLDESLKAQIVTSLNRQLNKKVYLEPNLQLQTLAEKCNTNRSYLSQFINEQYNMNFNTFINMLRINEAKQILSEKNNNIPLKELYLRLGFNSYSVFNEAFKKHIGVTPNFYLNTIKELFDNSNSSNIG